MRLHVTLPSILISAVLSTASEARAAPVGTAFGYQGQLKQGGIPVNDTCDFQFGLWNDPSGVDPGALVAGPIVFDGVLSNPAPINVVNGLFHAQLDFGMGVFNGQATWLQIAVCCSSPCAPAFTPLIPRQELTPVPNALRASEGVGPSTAINVDTATGEVGIGLDNPTEKLDVEGNIRASGTIHIGNSIVIDGLNDTIIASSGTISFDDNNLVTSGNVGIGVAAPSAPLDVGGPIAINGASVIDAFGNWIGNPTGLIGPIPDHQWIGTCLSFQKPDGTFENPCVDLKGDRGDIGATGATGGQGIQGPKGEKGDKGDPGPGAPACADTFVGSPDTSSSFSATCLAGSCLLAYECFIIGNQIQQPTVVSVNTVTCHGGGTRKLRITCCAPCANN